VAISDARCVFYDEDRAQALRDGYEKLFPKAGPKTTATVLGDGQHIELTISNASASPLVLPLFLSQQLDTYPVVARHGGTEVQLRGAKDERAAGTASWDRGRNFAQVTIAPGGVAFVRLRIDPTVIDSTYHCAPNAKCAPTVTAQGPLAAGTWELEISLSTYALHVPTAKLAWTQR
jgi:hypothetical protein